MAACTKNTHTDCDPDVCFAAKCAYWRKHGAPQVAYVGGRESFHERPSVFQRERDHIAEMKEAGIQFERASN